MHKIFVQSELLSDVTMLEVNPGTSPHKLFEQMLMLVPNDVSEDIGVYLEDCDDDDIVHSLKEVTDGLRFHLHRLKGVDVSVHYAGRCLNRTFRPSSTIARVKRWASQELGISPSDAADLALQISGTDQRPDVDVHIGSLVKHPCKTLAFDLVPSPRVNG